MNFDTDPQLSSLHLIAGGPPVTADDVVMDAGTAQQVRLHRGAAGPHPVRPAPPQTFTISGIAEFGSAGNLAGATLAAFTLPTAQAVAAGDRASSTTSTW